MPIKRIDDPNRFTCPRCGDLMRYRSATRRVECALCGFAQPVDEAEQTAVDPDPAPAPPAITPTSRPMRLALTERSSLSTWALASFESAQAAWMRGARDEAIKALERALDSERDFIDAHLWIGLLSEDETVKRNHLGEVIALSPGNLDAMRELMVLNGRLTRDQAERTHHHNEQHVQHIDGVVDARLAQLKCPTCGGHLTTSEDGAEVMCAFCGYRAARTPAPAGIAEEVLGMALLQRKAEPVRWVVGARLLHCQNCGADRTIPADSLSTRCPFCGSKYVVQQDVVGSFTQPNGLIPFEIDKAQAADQIKRRLKSLSERFMSLFEDNRIASGTLEAVYLPFWLFDALAQVTTRTTSPRTLHDRDTRDLYNFETGFVEAGTTISFHDGINDIPVCAVERVPPGLARDLGMFEMESAVPYDPKLLARYPASLYDIDYDHASLQARSRVGDLLREKHTSGDGSSKTSVASVLVLTMSFNLILAPVWMATLVERDGDVRVAYVNGQNGRVALGQARKPG